MDRQIIRGRCWFTRGDNSAGEEGDRWSNPNRGDFSKWMVPGAGEGDADGEEAAEDGMCGDSGVLFPAVLSPA
jgi:hypothetical protein